MSDTIEGRQLPKWQSTLKAIRAEGLNFGKPFTRPWLEQQLDATWDSIQFGGAIARINDELISDGYYLTSRNQDGRAYLVANPEAAEAICDNRVRSAFRDVRRAIKYRKGVLTNPNANLSAEQRRRLESKQEKDAVRLCLMQRSEKVRQVVVQHQPRLLETGE